MNPPRTLKLVWAPITSVLLACSSSFSPAPTPTPVAPTLTPLEAEEEALVAAWRASGEDDGRLARQGIRVIRPPSRRGSNDNTVGLPECTPAFPVAAMEYGVYYLPSDELYGSVWSSLSLAMCFASEQDAISAGYRRGPHGPG